MTRDAPPFAAPWHAELFALTVALNEAGHFGWPDWTGRFAATLARRGAGRPLDGGDDYFLAWLETLEAMLAEAGVAGAAEVEAARAAWEAAYLATPHGQPVRLARRPG